MTLMRMEAELIYSGSCCQWLSADITLNNTTPDYYPERIH